MIKKFLFIISILPTLAFAQVGIGTTTPLGALHIDGRKDTPANATGNQPDDFVIMSDGKVGIGTVTPEVNLDIVAKVSTGTATTPDGFLVPQVSLSRLKLIGSNTSLKYGTLLYVNDVTGTRDNTTTYVVFPGFYFWNNTYWAKVLTFDANYGVNARKFVYRDTSANLSKTVRCGRFEFGLQTSSSPYIYGRLVRDPAGSVTINPSSQNEHGNASSQYKYSTGAKTFTSSNYTAFQQFNTYAMEDRNIITMYFTYPGDTNFYRVEAFRVLESSATTTWTIVCSQF